MEVTLIWPAAEGYAGAFDLGKIGPFGLAGLLLILTASLALFSVSGTFGTVLGDTGFSPQQSLPMVKVTMLGCAGNPVQSAAIQLESLTVSQWTYTDSNGNAFLSVPPGTYTLRGGYSTFNFNDTISVGAEDFTVTVNLGGGCSGISISNTFAYYHTARFAR